MANGTLYTYPENFRAFKALIAAQYSGAKVTVDKDFKFGETNKSEAFLKKFPLGKVPAFESNDGLKLWDSNTIAYYVANEALRGADAASATQVQQFVNFAENEILPAACTWVFPCLGIIQYNKQNTDRAKDDIKNVLSILNSHLETKTFLVGERISLADIVVVCNLLLCYQHVFDAEFRKPYMNTNRWFLTCINQPQFKAVLGTFKLAEKMAQFDSKKFQELHGGAKKEQPKKEKKEKPKQEPKPKAEKPAEEPEDAPVEKKSKDPFAALPSGTLIMDDWKKTYSNEDTKAVAIPYFWDKFDKECYSIWQCEYKYADELKLVFMSCNLISGMFQRLDRMRKHSFGSMILFGENNKSTISGIWIWKGQDLAFEMSEDLQIDYSSYTWKKLDVNSEETKKTVNEYWAWEGDFGGKKFNQGKIFK